MLGTNYFIHLGGLPGAVEGVIMPIRIRRHDKTSQEPQKLLLKGLHLPSSPQQRHVMRAENRNPASYADQSNYC